MLFVIWRWIWQDFVIVWQNTPCTVCHPAVDCLPHWRCWTVLPDCVIQLIFHKNSVILHACVHGRRKEFFQVRPLVDISKCFATGGQKWWNLFFGLRKHHFCWDFQIPAPLPTPICLCVGNVRATPLKNLGNFKRFNTIPNSEILLNLIRKMKYLTDQFQLCFCVCIGNAK